MVNPAGPRRQLSALLCSWFSGTAELARTCLKSCGRSFEPLRPVSSRGAPNGGLGAVPPMVSCLVKAGYIFGTNVFVYSSEEPFFSLSRRSDWVSQAVSAVLSRQGHPGLTS